MKAVIIGAGRVACGFLAQALSESGYEVTLVGRRPDVVAALNRGSYLIDICHPDGSTSVTRVVGARAIALWDLKSLDEALAGARLIFTAAGARALPDVTTLLAKALLRRLSDFPAEGVDVISCENMANAVALVREAVVEASSPGQWKTVEHTVRFRRAMAWRIISDRRITHDGLRLRADDVERIDIESPRGWPSLPAIKGSVARPKMAEAIHEKLHVFNSGHAVAGYLGYLHGFEYIHDALQECSIAETVAHAIEEASSWPGAPDPGEDHSHLIRTCLRRYQNAAMRDRTVRVAARPLQKLAPFERLVLPAWATLTFGRTPLALADAIAAALRFDYWQDAEAISIQRRVREVGFEQTLEEISGLRPTDELTQIVLSRLATQCAASAGNGRTVIARAAAR